MAKIIYFIAGNVPTVGEAADIAKLEAATAKPYELVIRSNKALPSYGEGRFEACDFVAGTIPGAVVDADTQIVINDGDTLDAVGGGTIAVDITAGVATFTYTAP